ncbi:Protein of unknown function [Modicisalibacter ilicicola DSM 19980]|uniref:DUF533 domain-containing protein n=1 Tax=Modicisalibacter ilicicola DSM 19980 TaxID=1121942 RepID=A0A1M5BTM2_9GAMM|nr:DUF533 domain-containing protein [Halomonas ilicicola]SHF45878.1 Protein of unknown function [Halomonas ilicicola DSM 19980]
MEDRGAWDHLVKAAEELCESSQGRGIDTRSALAGGLLGLLISTRGGRSLLGKTLKYGTIAGLGALAWQARQGGVPRNASGTSAADGHPDRGGNGEGSASATSRGDEPPTPL